MDINDVIAMINVIDVATERGAFRGKELSSIGKLRDKLEAVVEQSQQAAQSSDVAEVEEAEVVSED